MPTNGMTIDSLNTVSSLTAHDEVPVWDKEASSEPTRKITAQNMANSVKSLASLPNTTEMNTAIAQSTADAIRTGDVVNSLTSTATDKPLSANMGKSLNDKLTTQDVASLFTNINSNVNTFNAKKGAKTVFLSFSIGTGVTNRTQLVEIPSSLKPAVCDYIAPLSSGNGKIYTDGSVWIERTARNKIVYYGSTLPEKKYVAISYLLE